MDIPSSVFAEILGRVETGVYGLNLERKVVYWNHGAERITGYLEQEVLGRALCKDLLVESEAHNLLDCVHPCPHETPANGQPKRTLTYLRHRAGHVVPVRLWTISLKGKDRQIIGSMKIFSEHLAEPGDGPSRPSPTEHQDLETGLADHSSVEAFLHAQVELANQRKVPCGVIAVQVSIDNFRHTHGKGAGVALMHEVGCTLQEMVRGTDLLGRWTDESFVAVLPDCGSEVLEQVAARMKRASSRVAIPWMGDRLSAAVEVRTLLISPGDRLETMMSRLFPSKQDHSRVARPGPGA